MQKRMSKWRMGNPDDPMCCPDLSCPGLMVARGESLCCDICGLSAADLNECFDIFLKNAQNPWPTGQTPAVFLLECPP